MFAAKYVERHSPSWKPSTLKATMSYLNSAILSAIGHLRVRAVVRADIACFFQEYRRRKPGGANRGHDILRNMFDCTNAWGHRSEAIGNPFTGLVRYRFRRAGDLTKLSAALRRLEVEGPNLVTAVRLHLLMGCRPDEICCVRWCEAKATG